MRYYDAAGTDVTGKVNAGTFTTPELALGGQKYVMRATVKVRSMATEGSSTTRLLTVSSVNAPAFRDSVRFMAALDFPSDARVTLSPADVVGTDDYQYWFPTGEFDGQATFTLLNEGTGPSGVLFVSVAAPGRFGLSNDACTGESLPAAGSCSFRVNYGAPTDCVTAFLGDVTVFGGSEEYLHLQLVAVCDLI